MKRLPWFLSTLIGTLILAIGTLAQANPTQQSELQTALTEAFARKMEHQQGPHTKLSPDLAGLYDEFTDALNDGALQETFVSNSPLLQLAIAADHVVIDAIAANDAQALLADLEALGLQNGAAVEPLVSGWLPITALEDAAALASLYYAQPAYALSNAGLTVSQGDNAMEANAARSTFNVDGSGVTIGTLSDSFDCRKNNAPPPLTNAAQDVASGDLPADIQVLAEFTPGLTAHTCIDEGRAMMQLITDVAPGARQQFHTAFNGQADFAQGIRELAQAGSDIIVDDVIYFAEPMFQDGIIAQAVDDVVAQGVAYFSSAGNYGRASYESVFRTGQTISVGGRTVRAHDFDPGFGVDIYQQIEIPANRTLMLVLQWDSPYRSVNGSIGSSNDLDAFFFADTNPPGNLLVHSSTKPNIGGDPIEIIELTNQASVAQRFNLLIGTVQGNDPGYIKYINLGGGTIQEYATQSSTIYGHANAAGASAVGAAAFFSTPYFGVNPPILERFSAAGPTPIFFNTDGSRNMTPEIRQKPQIVAPDGANTTFFGSDIPQDTDTFPNFFGTSAAAPHAAAVAALLLDARPDLRPHQIYETLQNTAIDMGRAGVDDDTGYGLIQANQALATLLTTDLIITKTNSENAVLADTPVTYTLTVENTSDQAAQNVILTDILPADADFISATFGNGALCAISDRTITCELGAIAGGESVVAIVIIRATRTGSITNTARVTTSTIELQTDNNSSSDTDRVVLPAEAADLAIAGWVSPNPADRNTLLTYTLSVSNIGPAAADEIVVSSQLPAGATFHSAIGAGWFCSYTNGVVTCTRPSLGVAAAPSIILEVTAPPTGANAANFISVTATTPDIRSANNTVTLVSDIVSDGQTFVPMILR
ncbi:MAG: S8 family serine peptidase [Chloroflexales bacterium]|nr:S8 family serine peptidase [Chloroflexales bacterium]